MPIEVIESALPKGIPDALTPAEKQVILAWANFAKVAGYGRFDGSFQAGVLENCSASIKEHRAILRKASEEERP